GGAERLAVQEDAGHPVVCDLVAASGVAAEVEELGGAFDAVQAGFFDGDRIDEFGVVRCRPAILESRARHVLHPQLERRASRVDVGDLVADQRLAGRTLRAGITLLALRPLRSRITLLALRPLRSRITLLALRPLRSRITLLALRPRRTLRAGITLVARAD